MKNCQFIKKCNLIVTTFLLLTSSHLKAELLKDANTSKKNNEIGDEVLFRLMRKNFHDKIVLGTGYDINDTRVKAKINDITTKAYTYWNSMEKAPLTYLWSNYNELKASVAKTPSHVFDSYDRLLTMSLAYSYKSSKLSKNPKLLSDIITGLNFLHTYAFNEATPRIGNFWEWHIGVPECYARIISLLYDELPVTIKDNYEKTVISQLRDTVINGNYVFSGQASTCKNLIFCGILTNKLEYIEIGLNNITRAFISSSTISEKKYAQQEFERLWKEQGSYVNYNVGKKQSFYEDGTFIQHIALPYIGGYGYKVIEAAAQLPMLFEGTGINLPDQIKSSLKTWFSASFPAIYEGEMMMMYLGRFVKHNPHYIAKVMALDIAKSADMLDDPAERREIKEQCKRMFTHNSYYASIYDGVDPILGKPRIDELLNDSSLSTYEDKPFNMVMAAGDRVIHHRPSFRFGISMSSSRIGKFESLNNENTKGWYTGDGMTYLYNSDRGQYVGYFSRVNSKRLPGTTVDVIDRQTLTVSNYGLFGIPKNAKDWVGGVSLRKLYGTAGMHLVGEVSSFEAKKSWFMFDNEIVALGAGIKLTENRSVETIVENRSSLKPLYVDNIAKPQTKGWEENLNSPSWIHLEGTSGYYFPELTKVNACRDNNGFTQLFIDHGVSPSDAKYAYVLLPGETKESTVSYSANPDIRILSNTEKLQAVIEQRLNVLGVNFWEPGKIDIVKSECPASVMLERYQDMICLSVSDPTWKQSEIVLDLRGRYKIVSGSARIKVTVEGSNTRIIINTLDRMGMTEEIILKNIR